MTFKEMIPEKFEIMRTDARCRENTARPISRKQCRNNCKMWNFKDKNCSLGYNR
jgi:hypothetical protein